MEPFSSDLHYKVWRKTMPISVVLIVLIICHSLPRGLATDVGDEESVYMTVVVSEPIGGDRYSCFLSSPDANAQTTYARYIKTRTNSYSYNYYNREPTGTSSAGIPGSFRVFLDRNYQNYFGIFYCRAGKPGRLLTTITATVLLANAKIVPADGMYTKTVNTGDVGVVIEMTALDASNNEFAWRFNNSGFKQLGDSSSYSIGRAVTKSDAGVYECHYDTERYLGRQGLVRLIVRGCPAGRWGLPSCSGVCDKCYNGGICNDVNGRCVCPAGFSGRNCLNACGRNKFGFSCEIGCSSRTNSCNGQVFCLPDPLGCTCATGFKDRDCETECEPGKFGASCLQACHCRQASSCDRHTGQCTGANNGCDLGWSGDSCQIPAVCGDDYYGDDCTRKCECTGDQSCDKATGECSNGQCKLGFAVYPGGLHCEECQGGTYGLNCAGVCNCDEANCAKATGVCNGGCKRNWADPDCTTGVLSFVNNKANSGQESVFTCTVTGNPLPSAAAVKVYRPSITNDEQYTPDTDTVVGSDRTVTFSIPAVELNEVFTCYTVEPNANLDHFADMHELPALTRPLLPTDTQAREVTVEWDAWSQEQGDPGDPPITAYTVYYRPQADGTLAQWQRLTDVPVGTMTRLSSTVGGLEPETGYELGVSVTREGRGGEGVISARLSVTTLCSEPLMSPSNVQSSSQQQVPRQIAISWQVLGTDFHGCSTGITQYRIRYTSSIGAVTNSYTFKDIDDPLVTTDNLTHLEPYTQYGISVSAVNEIGVGPWSDDVVAYSPEEMPPPPEKVTIPRSNASSITVLTLASTPYNLNGNVSHYLLRYQQVSERSQSEAIIKHISETGFTMTYTLTGLISKTDFNIQVKIVNGFGESEWSKSVRASTVNTGDMEGQTGSGGGIAGGLVGALFAVIVAALIVVIVIRRRRLNKSAKPHKINGAGTTHKNIAYDNTIYENTGVAGVIVAVPTEDPLPLANDMTIYENTVQAEDAKPVVAAAAGNRIPQKPNRKPPPPSSSDHGAAGKGGPPTKATLADDTDADDTDAESSKKDLQDHQNKQSSDVEPDLAPSQSTPDDQCEYGNVNLGPTLSVPIPVGQLDDYIKGKKASSTDNLKYEFSLLPTDQTRPWTVASNPDLKTRNRFKNIIPYDHSRVPLEPIEEVPLSNYYNASYVQDHKQRNSFIAAMGPNAASLNDLWRMIWQEKINIIVMLTQLVENKKDKCKRYWPTRLNQEDRYGKIVVKLLDQESFSDYTIHTLEIYQVDHDEIRHTIKHFNMTSWPDMGVPLYPTSVLNLVQVVKDTHTQMPLHNSADEADTPLLVHCSAGVGRTGTFIAIHTLLDQMKEQRKVSVFGFVNQMRENRVNMVQTYDQYVFIYSALLEGHLSGDTRIPVRYFVERFTKLKKLNPKTRKRYIDEEFKTLNRVTPMPGKAAFVAALLPENVDKNRFADVLPLERNRPFLVSEGTSEGTSYINASFVDSVKHKDAFITTQMPLPHTVGDIWRLVYDWHCPTIVMMNDPYTANDESANYLPDSGVAEFGPMSVEVVAQSKGRVYNSTTLKISRRDSQDKSLTVKHFHLQGWATNENKPNSPLSILELLDAVQTWHQECKSTSPTIVQCINGVGRSGVFCTVSTVAEKMAREEVIDVFQAVKRLRMNRPQMIESLDQYILCYEVIHHRLEHFQQYDNLL